MTLAEAQDAIRAGAKFGDVYESAPEPERGELKRWFCFDYDKPKAAPAKPGASTEQKKRAKDWGYTGEECLNPNCRSIMVRRNGSCLMCDTCGQTTGCS